MGELLTAIGDVLTSEAAYTNALTFAVFLAFGATGEWVAERSGTLNVSLEAMLLAGAFAAVMGQDVSDNELVGLVFGMGAGLAVALVQAHMSHNLTANQFVVGLTLNILVLGLTSYLDSELSPAVIGRADTDNVPFLVDIPLIGPALFGRSWLFHLIWLIIPVCWWLVYRTRWGLELRASGEDPQAADVSGIDVNKRRRQGIYVAGLTAGAGGAYVLSTVVQFEDSLVNGRGFIALVAVIFGGWTLRGTLAGCLLFGIVLSFRLSLPAVGYELNGDLLASLPFVITILAMAVFAKRVRPPAALAAPFIRGLK